MTPDVLVMGAGPAGCAAAIELAALGASVLLVDRARFPRPKVCGCCLGPLAVGELRRMGVEPLAQDDALALGKLQLRAPGTGAEMVLVDSVVAGREALDARLLGAVRDAGVEVMTGTRARLGDSDGAGREVLLGGDHAGSVRAPVVVLATGLPVQRAGTAAARPGGRIGLSQSRAAQGGPAAGAVLMTASSCGYVGMVRLGDGRLNVAASLPETAVRLCGSPGVAVDAVLREAGLPPLRWHEGWRGTPALRFAAPMDHGPHTLTAGDAAGFWEPFTGEGIGWALRGGRMVAATALRLSRRWDARVAAEWQLAQRRWLRRAQRRSRVVAALAGRPRLAAAVVAAAGLVPAAAGRVLGGGQATGAPA